MLVWPLKQDELVYQKDHLAINEDDLFVFFESRRGKLDGVVVTGGEPTLHPDLPQFLAKIKALGFAVKLDTNGTNPAALLPLLTEKRGGTRAEAEGDLVDYFAMDIKAPLAKYEQVVGVAVVEENIKKTIELIKQSGVPYEFRTTLVPGLHTLEDISEMGKLIEGADKWYLQFFKSDTPLVNHDFEKKDKFTHVEMDAMAEEGKRFVKFCEVRG